MEDDTMFDLLITGIPTVEHNRMTGALPGRFLAR